MTRENKKNNMWTLPLKINHTRMKVFKFILFTLLFAGCNLVVAQNALISFNYNEISINPSTPKTITISDPGISPLNYELASARLYAVLDMGEDYKLGEHEFEFSVGFSIEGFGANNTTIISLFNKQLTINTTGPEQYYYFEFNDHPEIAKFEISGVSIITENPDPMTIIAQNSIRLHYYTDIVYKIDVHNFANNPLGTDVNTLSGSIITNRIQTFNWDGTLKFPNYQFELLRLYNTDINYTSDLTEIKTKIDWSRALKIETYSSDTNLTISIAEGTGFYVWRVRPIGSYYEGGIANFKNHGAWSTSPQNGDEIILNLSNLGGTGNPYFYYEDPDEDINWMYGRTFTEENKISEQISYAGGLLHTKQTQTHLQSNGKALAVQSILDYSGRPALTTLPVPLDSINTGGLEGYRYSLVQTANGLYSADDFDTDNKVSNPDTVKTSDTPFSYYSNKNLDLTIPDADGYAFTRNIFYPDGTGRVKEQSGVGKTHAVGLQTDGRGRTVRTYYGTPSDEELLRIFGDEAPAASSVFTTITIDQNNSINITYTSKSGQVIATNLATADDDFLNPPDGANTSGIEINNSITDNIPIEKGFISTKRAAFSVATNLALNYDISCETLIEGCNSISADCEYKVQFLITDITNGIIYRTPEHEVNCSGVNGYLTVIPGNIWTPATGNVVAQSATEVLVQPGNYIFMKRIISYADPSNQVGNAISQQNEQIQPLVDLVTGWLFGVKSESDLAVFYNRVQLFNNQLITSQTNSDYTSIKNDYSTLAPVDLSSAQLELQPPYTGNNRPQKLLIKGGCCPVIELPISYTPQFNCPDIVTIIANPHHADIDFEGYMMARLSFIKGTFTNINTDADLHQLLLPAYSYSAYLAGNGQFNAMIWHMLTDKYYCGRTILQGNTIMKMEPIGPGNANGGNGNGNGNGNGGNNGNITIPSDLTTNDLSIQYKCSDLWKCWASIVSSYNYLKDLNGSYNVADGIDNQDNENGESGTFNNTADNKDNVSVTGWIINKIVERAINKRLRGDQPGEDRTLEFELDLAREFLQCTGYAFAKIIEPQSTEEFYRKPLATDILGSNDTVPYETDLINGEQYQYDANTATYILAYTNTDAFPYKYNPVDRVSYITANNKTKLRYPYILDPVFAFKYYTYDGKISSITLNDSSYYSRNKQLEISMCYQDLTQEMENELQSPNIEFCNDPDCDEYHEKWNCDERRNFYIAITSFKDQLEASVVVCEPAPEIINYNLDDSLSLLMVNCNAKCEERRAQIRSAVVSMFTNNCYEIGGCPDDENVILDRDIDKIVQAIIDTCVGTCNTFDDDKPVYPKIYYDNCSRLGADNWGWCIIFNYPFIELLSECNKEQHEMILWWTFNINLPAVKSMCIPPRTMESVWWNNNEHCPPGVGDFSKSKELIIELE